MNKIKNELSFILKNAIKELYNIELETINLENPPKKDLWDFAFWCFVLSKETKKNPAITAQELAQKLVENTLISKAEPAGPYLNIKLSYDFYSKIFNNYIEKDLNIWKWEKLVVDYTWINVWKPMHIWHVCPSSQWQVTINLAKKLGFDVISDTHIWDWWIIFWKLITAFKYWGEESRLKVNAVDYLLELYVKITAEIEVKPELEEECRNEFKILSEWNTDSIKLWSLFTKESINAMNILLWRLSIKPQYNIWESFYEWLHLPKMEEYPDLEYSMADVVKELVEKWIATKNEDGSVWVVFPESTKIPSCILQKNNWTHGYLASDLACVKYRMQNWSPKRIIYHVDVRQQLHLQQVFEVSKLAWWLGRINPSLALPLSLMEGENKECELFHAYNWFISLKDWAMSSRKWNIIKLDTLLNEARDRAKKIILEKRQDLEETELNEIAEIVWIWAIKYGYLSKSRTTDMIFDWDEFMTFEWNSGPYVSYNYVRTKSLLKNSWLSVEEIKNAKTTAFFETDDEVYLFKMLEDYGEVLLETFDKILPHILVGYVYNLTKAFSSFYNNVSILSETDEEKKKLRLKLILKFQETLFDAFEILAIRLPEKM